MTPTATSEELEGSGTENGPGGVAAGGGATSDATTGDADAAGAGGRHGADKRERDKVASRRVHPLDRFPCRFPPIPLMSPSASFQHLPPPLWFRPPPLMPNPPSPLHSTRCCWLRSPLCPSRPRGTNSLHCCLGFPLAGPQSIFPSHSLPTPLSLLPPSPPSPSLTCLASLSFCTWIFPLLPYPSLYHPLGYCVRLRHTARLLPRPRPPILTVRTKVSVTRQARVRHSGKLRAGPRRTGSALAGPSSWWGTVSAVPCSCTAPNISTPCTVGRRYRTRTPWQTGPWWSRSSARCSCSTDQPACGIV